MTNKKVVEKVVEKVSKNQKEILILLEQNPKMSAREISVKLKISHRKTQENMMKLKDMGKLERIGSAKGGYWKIIK